MRFPQEGGCQCGAIRYELRASPAFVFACHCTDCQAQSGSAFGMAAMMRHADFHLTRGMPGTFEQATGSGKKRVCWYCRDCGTRLVHMMPGKLGEMFRNVKPGTLDDASWVRPAAHFWTRSAMPWVTFSPDDVRFETQTDAAWLLDRAGGMEQV